jgi:hypothetical protein
MYGYASVPNYNNRPTTTHKDILDLYDRAIALAIKEAPQLRRNEANSEVAKPAVALTPTVSCNGDSERGLG